MASATLENGSTESASMPKISTVDDEMVVEILNFFYPTKMISKEQLNDQLRNLAAEMYRGALEMSKVLNMLPTGALTKPGLFWLGTQAVKLLWRTTKGSNIDPKAKNAIAYKYKHKYDLAKENL